MSFKGHYVFLQIANKYARPCALRSAEDNIDNDTGSRDKGVNKEIAYAPISTFITCQQIAYTIIDFLNMKFIDDYSCNSLM